MAIDSFVNMEVTWKGRKTEVKRVASVKHPPFPLILGADWIVDSKTDLIVAEGKIVPVAQQIEEESVGESIGESEGKERVDTVIQPEESLPSSSTSDQSETRNKKKTVSFGLVRVREFYSDTFKLISDDVKSDFVFECKGKEEESFGVSDDLICSFQEKGRLNNKMCGQRAKVQWRTNIPSESLKFVRCKLKGKKSGTVLVQPNRNSFPGKEWCIPSCLVCIEKGIVYVPVLNLSGATLEFKPKDCLTAIEFSYDAKIELVENAKKVKEEEGEEYVCAAVHYEPEPFTTPEDEIQLGSGLTEEMRQEVLFVLSRHRKCFPSSEKVGSTSLVEFTIDTGDAKPVRSHPIRVSSIERRIIAQKVEKFLRQGLVRPSTSPWAASVVLVRKKNQDYCFCADYRRLNAVTKRDTYPLPRADDIFDRLAGAKWFASIDLLSGYYQVPVAEKDIEKTAFITPDGLFEFTRMPQGVHNGPGCFQRLMDRVLRHLKWSMCLVYLDDCLVFGSQWEEFLERLDSRPLRTRD